MPKELTQTPTKKLGLSSLRSQRARNEGGKEQEGNTPSKSILSPKRLGSVRLNYTIRGEDEATVERARSEMSIFLRPLSVAELIEAVSVACHRDNTMALRASKKTEAYKGASILKDTRQSTVWFPALLSDFLMQTVDPSPMKSITYFLRWIAEDWEWIRKHFKHTSK